MNDKELDIALQQLRQKDYPENAFQSKEQFKASFLEKAAAQDKQKHSQTKYIIVSFLSAAACAVAAIVFAHQGANAALSEPPEQPELNEISVSAAAQGQEAPMAESATPAPTPVANQQVSTPALESAANAAKRDEMAKKKKSEAVQVDDMGERYHMKAPPFEEKMKRERERAQKIIVRHETAPSRTPEFNTEEYKSYQEFNTEEYKSYEDNPFLEVRTNPLSTFGADVDTASYTNLRRLLAEGKKPDRNAVRTEELLNYFNYDYSSPENGEKFAVNFEMMDAPWNTKHKLLLIGVQAKKVDVKKLPPSNFVFLIDNSGSMSRYMNLVRESMIALADTMRPQDTISIVTYGGNVNVLLQGINGQEVNKQEIKEKISGIVFGGYTPGGAGIQEAYKLAHKYFIQGGNNRIILITDGDFNVGASSESELVSMVEKERQSAIYLTAIGVGRDNYKDNKLKMLANKGNGNYLYWDSIREARNSLLNEMTGSMFTLAKDVKFQLEMNPAKIHSYRLIGYEFRKLTDRDFNDDTKDSGEVGIGQQVTVLYELVMADGENKSGVDDLKYQKVKPSGSSELLTCKMRYQEPEGNAASVKKTFVLESMPTDGNNIHWAAAVAEFALILRESPHKGNADLNTLRQRAQKYLGNDKSGKRIDFLNMIRNAEDLK